jgi:sn-glycerol 3-phosphate transport system permease protein
MEKRVLFRSTWLPWLLLAPQLLIVAVFFFWPAGQALVQSLQQQDAFGNTVTWVGLDNFRTLLNDETYLASFQTTLVFSTLVTVLGLSIALVLAIFADRVLKGAGLYKTVLILPYAVAPVVTGLLWAFMFSSSIGIVTYWLKKVGIQWNHLLNGNDAMAGLNSIPKSLIEAAAIDGARPWRRFWTIIFPLLSPTAFFLLVINMVYAFFDTFAIIDATTQGGPGKDTATLVYRVYFDGFRGMDFGGSAAQSVVLMVIVIGLTIVQFRYVEKKVNY